jgi:hypothetical protein
MPRGHKRKSDELEVKDQKYVKKNKKNKKNVFSITIPRFGKEFKKQLFYEGTDSQ